MLLLANEDGDYYMSQDVNNNNGGHSHRPNSSLRNGVNTLRSSDTEQQALLLRQRRRQSQFVATLEHVLAEREANYAGGVEDNGGSLFQQIAEELNWTFEEVEQVAYRYYLALADADPREEESQSVPQPNQNGEQGLGRRSTSRSSHNQRRDSHARGPIPTLAGAYTDRPWTQDELALLNILLASYQWQLPLESPNSRTLNYWFDLVAQNFPGRSTLDVRRRCRQILAQWIHRDQRQQQQQQPAHHQQHSSPS